MKVKLLQVSFLDPDFGELKSNILRFGMSRKDPNDYIRGIADHYREVYSGDLKIPPDATFLSYVYDMFNVDMPANYTGQSMSSGDILLYYEDDTWKGEICKVIGWEPLVDDLCELFTSKEETEA